MKREFVIQTRAVRSHAALSFAILLATSGGTKTNAAEPDCGSSISAPQRATSDPTSKIQDGIDPLTYRNANGWTLLMIAANEGREDVVEALLKKGADPNVTEPERGATAVFVAAHRGHDGIIRLLAKHGADLNVKSPEDGASPIILACMAKRWETVKTLVELGADPGAVNAKGLSPILYAAGEGNTAIVQYLQSNGVTTEAAAAAYEAARKARRVK